MNAPAVWIDPEECVGCGLCIEACGRKLIQLNEDAAIATSPERCVGCGHCKAVCPVNAPRLAGLAPDDFCSTPLTLPAPDELLAFMRSRRSIRNYTDQQVELDKLEMILQAGRYAPTGQNRQALHYTVANRPESIDLLRRLTVKTLFEQAERLDMALQKERHGGSPLSDRDQPWRDYPPAFRLLAELTSQGLDPLFHDAPAVMAVHVSPREAIHPEVETDMAAMQMALMANSLGLGTCYCGLLDYAAGHSPELRRAMGLLEGHLVPVSFMLGYPDITYSRLVARRPVRVTWISP